MEKREEERGGEEEVRAVEFEEENRGNAICIRKWVGNEEDDEQV